MTGLLQWLSAALRLAFLGALFGVAFANIGTPAPESQSILERYHAVTMLPPPYPLEARRLHIDARGVRSVRIGRTGDIVRAWMKRSTGYRSLDDISLSYCRRWRFIPQEPRTLDVPLHFSQRGCTFE